MLGLTSEVECCFPIVLHCLEPFMLTACLNYSAGTLLDSDKFDLGFTFIGSSMQGWDLVATEFILSELVDS